jgi:hypothetical protein
MSFVDPGYAIQQSLDWPKYRVHERLLAIEHTRHEDAHRFGNQENEQQKEQYLKPTIRGHDSFPRFSPFFRFLARLGRRSPIANSAVSARISIDSRLISEFLRAQQRVHEIYRRQYTDCEHDH